MRSWVAIGRRLLMIGGVWLFPGLLWAATPTPEIQQAISASTFEVVLRKSETDPLSYEKPPPLELIPYNIRSDKYWSIGTAFAIAPDTYVSAGHVFLAAVGSQFGAPQLRDAAGHVYPVNQVVKFSAQEDFVVFTISGAPAATPLPTEREHKFNDVVFAVGNALGEGIIVRDGLLTSETPENQDGRWKWLRFSAAASPGNSGGPLLDSNGRVIGIVTAKSQNENLNYALPIARVLDAKASVADFDLRYSTRLPNMRQEQVATLKTQFPLPKSFADFSSAYQELSLRSSESDQQKLRTSLADQIFPKGNSSKLLATVYNSELPTFIQQNKNDVWDAVGAENTSDQDLPGKGLVSVGTSLGVTLFRIRRSNAASDAAFYQNSSQYMDVLLKGLKLPRTVGDQDIRITSLGRSKHDSVFDDSFGRHWQMSYWPLEFTDAYVVCFALPTPEGYSGMVQMVPSAQLEVVEQYLREMTDFVYLTYSGTVTQWKAFLANSSLRPKVFGDSTLKFDDNLGITYQSPRLSVKLARDLIGTSNDSELLLDMTYISEGGKLVWDVGGIYLYKDHSRGTYVGLHRHSKPGDDAPQEIQTAWSSMLTRGAGFNGTAGHDDDYRNYWIHDAVGSAPASQGDSKALVLYDVMYATDAAAFPRDLDDTERRLIQSAHILEH